MKRLASSILCLLALATVASAQVGDGSIWTDGQGNTVKVQVVDPNPANPAVFVTFIDSGGFSPTVTGTAAPGSTTDKPKAKSSAEASTNSPQPNRYRLKDGKLQRHVNGKWVTYKEIRKRNKKQGTMQRTVPQPWLETGPGEEGTSIPGGPQSL